MRIMSPPDRSKQVLELLRSSPSACNVVFLEGVGFNPDGDVVLADVAREDASVLLGDLRELDLDKVGSISIQNVDASISPFADAAEKHAKGAVQDAVVWEMVEGATAETTELSASFMIFMVISGVLAGCALFLDSPVLLIGAMVVGPEFGPIAGFCVAVVDKRYDLARHSLLALTLGLPLAITAVFVSALIFKATGITEPTFESEELTLTKSIVNPDFFSGLVAVLAGVAGTLSLSTSKSGAIIGVFISIATMPSVAAIGITAAYGDGDGWVGSMAQLSINVVGILLAGTATLAVQRGHYARRRRRHLVDESRTAAGLPIGRSRRGTHQMDQKEMARLMEERRAEHETQG